MNIEDVTIERFWTKVDKTPGHGPDGDCWLWIASTFKTTGYGQFYWLKKVGTAHRFSYLLHYGSIPDGLWILHRCDNRACVNPSHLWAGTAMDNSRDMDSKGRSNRLGFSEGEKHPLAKITESDVRKIRTVYAGKPLREIARDFNMSETNASDIRRRKTWKHVY